MEANTFLSNFRNQFDDENLEISLNTKFKELEEWTSLMGLSIIAMVDDEYNISITGNDIRNSNTIEDLFEIVKSKANV